MPATEQTWRNQRRLHSVFAVTCLAMMGATLWLLYNDSARTWKNYQRTAVTADLRTNAWRQQVALRDSQDQREQARQRLLRAQSQPIPDSALAPLKEQLQKHAQETNSSAPDFRRLDQAWSRFNDAAERAQEARRQAQETFVQWSALRQQAGEGQLSEESPSAESLEDQQRSERDEAALRATYEREHQEALALEEQAARRRQELFRLLNDNYLLTARRREDLISQQRKFASADLDALRANRDLAIRDNLGEARVAEWQEQINQKEAEITRRTLEYQDASEHRQAVDQQIKTLNTDVERAQKELDDARADVERLQTAFDERQSTFFVNSFPWLGKRWLELPILDAFNSPRKIDNLWTAGLTQRFGSFGEVRRFDRCTTCHQGIDKTQPGSAIAPAFATAQIIELRMATPAERPQASRDRQPNLLDVYGFELDPQNRGVTGAREVTVTYINQGSLASRARAQRGAGGQTFGAEELREQMLLPAESGPEALSAEAPQDGLAMGDVILQVDGTPVSSGAEVERRLLQTARWGQPVRLQVRRGLPNPYCSHPRMDLFVGSLSPHPSTRFACTICHDGQGSATDFKWASHSPNDPEQAERWRREYGWFYNHHWIHPMNPSRFSQSGCVKCHHDVTELEPSERFPEPPADKLVQGHRLISKYGCYGCHEINGYDGDRRIGPDMRLEPNYFGAALQLSAVLSSDKADVSESQTSAAAIEEAVAVETAEGAEAPEVDAESLAEQIRELAYEVAHHPENSQPRHRLLELLERDMAQAQAEGQGVLPPQAHALVALLKDVDTPGTLRKPGPSLRHAASKLDFAFMADWIRQPSHFRPSTRMPQFFELDGHMEAAGDEHGVLKTHQYEPLEVLGMTLYLLDRSQEFEYLAPAEQAEQAEEEDAQASSENEAQPQEGEGDELKLARGKVLFETRGCLACHTHADFPDADRFRNAKEIVQGPDLTGLGSKFDAERNPNGRRWLYTWLKEPTRYHVRTLMPDTFLVPFEGREGQVIDPADDIVEYLLSSRKEDWQPTLQATYAWTVPSSQQPDAKPVRRKARAEIFVDEAGTLSITPADADLSDSDREQMEKEAAQSLRELTMEHLVTTYFKKAAERYYEEGIPEDRRAETRGAEVEMIGENVTDRQRLMYLGRRAIAKYGCFGCHDIPGFEDAKPIGTGLADWGLKEPEKLAFEHIHHYLEHDHGHGHGHGGGHGQEAAEDGRSYPGAEGFFHHAILAGHREGFIYQKLKEPRSYDYHKTENKGFNERLRMPQFPFDDGDREEIITFVLGLVADPPAPQFVYQPDERQATMLAGKQVLEKFNCAGCHMLSPQQWEVAHAEGEFDQAWSQQASAVDFPFVRAHFPAQELAESRQPDQRGLRLAKLFGMPAIDNADGKPLLNDSEGEPLYEDETYRPDQLEYVHQLWLPAPLDGHAFTPGIGANLLVPADSLEVRRAAEGGDLAKMLLSKVVAYEKQLDADSPESQAWASMFTTNPRANGGEAWGWLPPPLVRQGEKVQTEWLHNFLLDPHLIRPATVLRMPRFNMSSEEASALVNYFAAYDEAPFPYAFKSRTRSSHLAAANRQYVRKLDGASDEERPEGEARPDHARLDHAMNIAAKICVQCHILGDFVPQTSQRAMAPNLAEVYRRMRPDYLRQWIANPKTILPYTSMPVNIPYDKPVDQRLYHGSSVEQVDALVDLLMNYDEHAKSRSEITPLVQALGGPEQPQEEADAAEAATGGE